MSAVDDVQAHLRDLGLVDGSSEWPSVRRRMHDGTDRLVGIGEDGGPEPEPRAAEGIGSAAHGTSGVHIRVRAEPWNGDASLEQATDILEALDGIRGGTVGATHYIGIQAMTEEPVFVGFDEKGRPEHTVALRLTRGRSAPLQSI